MPQADAPSHTLTPLALTSDNDIPKPPTAALRFKPDATPGASPWPRLVLMHGFGSNPQDLWALGQHARELGWDALSVPGPETRKLGRYAWPRDNPALTHAYLQSVLAQTWPDRRPVYLAGFSQGALHAAWLTAAYADDYLGVVALSPGGWVERPWPLAPARPLCLSGGQEERPEHLARQRELLQRWRDAGAPHRVWTHPGEHHLSDTWPQELTDCLRQVFGAP